MRRAVPGQKERRLLHFTMGELLDADGRCDEALMHFDAGNALKQVAFDVEDHARKVDDIIAAYSLTRMPRIPASSSTSRLPVFVLGLPRSGTTLVEQILAGHPDVAAAGELQSVPALANAMPQILRSATRYPWCLSEMSGAVATVVAERYLETLCATHGSKPRVTDKLPYNFFFVGLISKLFPGASIIHCVRDAFDTALSGYFTDFIGVHDHAYRLDDLAAYMNDYARLMRHWRDGLNIRLLDVRYEQLIADPTATVHQILDHCGLPWHEQCERVHETRRVVVTASNDQVRRPIYASSVGRARKYPRVMQVLRERLNPALWPEARGHT
jgi:hypothetical protein